MPSRREILWWSPEAPSKNTTEKTSIKRSSTSNVPTPMFPKIATGSPNTIQMLKMLLPMTLPTMRSVSPRLAAVIVVTSSGKEVPNATIVRAIMRSDTPMAVAIKVAELTTSCEPTTTPTRPTMTSKMEIGRDVYSREQ